MLALVTPFDLFRHVEQTDQPWAVTVDDDFEERRSSFIVGRGETFRSIAGMPSSVSLTKTCLESSDMMTAFSLLWLQFFGRDTVCCRCTVDNHAACIWIITSQSLNQSRLPACGSQAIPHRDTRAGRSASNFSLLQDPPSSTRNIAQISRMER